MNKPIFLSMVSIFVLLMAVSAHGQPGFEQGYTKSSMRTPLSIEIVLLDERLDQFPNSMDSTWQERLQHQESPSIRQMLLFGVRSHSSQQPV